MQGIEACLATEVGMAKKVFEATNITKKYKQSYALNNFNMEIQQGTIYGFVGKNGAGKTTLIRILAGFSKQTSGKIELFGESDNGKLHKKRGCINGIIETPWYYPNMTAQDNLEICRLQRGITEKGCIKSVLQIVGLQDVSAKKVRDFSLGMRQRLGLAMGLLGNPKLLFLDEPINGLDPVGIIELRELLKKLNKEYGITILISSHLLSELHQLATCYGFIHKGKMIEQITANALEEKCKKYLYIKVCDAVKAEAILRTTFHTGNLEVISENEINLYEAFDKTGEIVKALASEEITVEEISVKGNDLEKYYISLIERKN